MTPPQATPHGDARQGPFRWQRLDMAQAFADFADPFDPPCSQRHYAQQHAIPRSTLGDWLRRDAPQGVDADLTDFLKSPAGEAFLRRVVLALFLVFHFRSLSGLRALGSFLELTGLDHFVAPSYGALHDMALRLEQDLLAFDKQERSRLAAGMTKRSIALCLDENFHRAQPYLVAIEPASNFLLLEAHAPSRDALTWKAALDDALAGLPVEVLLLCSDQAKALLAVAKDGLQVPHSPDLMHIQRNIQKPLLLPLSRQSERAQKDLQQAQQELLGWQQRHSDYQKRPGPGRPPDFQSHIEAATRQVQEAQAALLKSQQRQQDVSVRIRALADVAHPFDATSGQPLEAEEVEKRLAQPLGRLDEIVVEAGLSQAAEYGVCHGHDWAVVLVALVGWFWSLARRRVEALTLREEAQRAVYEQLLPGLYWQQQARRGRDAEQKRQGRELSQRLLKQAWQEGGALSRLEEGPKAQVLRCAQELAGLFVRSSSCVEGRNGRLSLLQHSHVRLSKGRLQAQTTVHNYLVRREDGSTAAERFFGQKQSDLFAWLLGRLPDLPRPAAKRPNRAAKQPQPPGGPRPDRRS
jgi:hypothetical protein